MVKRMDLDGFVFTFLADETWSGEPDIVARSLTLDTAEIRDEGFPPLDIRQYLFYETVRVVGGSVLVDDEVLDYAGEDSPNVNY